MAVADDRMTNCMSLPEKLVIRKRCLGKFRKRIFHEEKARVRTMVNIRTVIRDFLGCGLLDGISARHSAVFGSIDR